jgi:hypothetical protein
MTVTVNDEDFKQGVRATVARDSADGGKYVIGFTNVLLNTTNIPDNRDWVGLLPGDGDLINFSGGHKQVVLVEDGKSFSGTGSSSFFNTDFSAVSTLSNIDLAVDFDNMTYWFRVSTQNSNAWQNSGNPATNTNGRIIKAADIYFPSARLAGVGQTATLNPAPSDLPSGFSAWGIPPDIVVPNKRRVFFVA